jgi:alkanesulfonate monooxygenase SsuD/methylene tetrahydromethanopterin reductase-like flavin-dependent oxidoreductase (luciferase family)
VTTPKFGVALSFQVHPGLGEPYDRSYRESLELAAEANRLGYESIWVSEHHGEADGYCPSPIVAGAALAAVAPHCRIGQAVALAPLHGHPLRLAEDLAVLDNLSGGRVEIGLGQGYRVAEFEMFGWPYIKRTSAFEESLDILGLAWRGERFDYDGRIYKVKAGLLRPPPIRPGPLPLWIGAAAPKARARAVRYGAGLLVAPLIELRHLERQIRSFDEEAVRQNAGPLPHALMREVLVGDSAADAIKRHQAFLDHVYRVQYAPERTGQTYVDAATGERKPLTGDNPYYLSEAFLQERWFLGTPADIAAKMAEWLPRFALDHLIFQARQPGMSLRHAVDSLEAIIKGVVPIVRAKSAQSGGSNGKQHHSREVP